MAEINVTITEQTNPSVTINTIPRGVLSGQIVSNDAEIASLIAATGTLTGATGALSTATGELSAATGNLNLALTDPTGALTTSLNNLSGSLTGAFNNDLNSLSGTLTGATGELVKISDTGLFYPRDNPSGFVTGSADLDLSSFISSGGDAEIAELTITGNSTLSKTLNIFPPQGRAITARATNSNNAAIQVVFEGPTTVGHDFFKQAGFTNGFGDGSNHFHDLTDINRIKQADEGDVKNLERVQERYYAITDNNLPNGNAAFWAWHRTARKISTSNVDTSNATLNVTGLQGSSNRLSDSQKPFRFNTSPVGKSEDLVITLNSHTFSTGDNVKMIFSQAFEGPIVAAGLFGKVSSTTTNTFNVELYGGNYKTTSEVALGTSQTALDFEFVTLQTVGTDTIVQNGNEVNLQHYSKTNFTPNRLRDNTLKASWSSAHGLKKNETLMIITAADRSTLEVKQGGYVIDPDPDGDGLSAIIVYGRRIDTIDLASFTGFGASNWSIHKGSIDGIHDDTLGDNLFNFNANNVGEYKQYQIGPGCETDADCISIGKNVYNKDASTIKIGYDNEMLNITSAGIDTTGTLAASGTIKSASYEPADFPDTTSVRTTAAFKEDGTMVQDSKVIVKKVTGAEAKAMSFGTPSSWIEMIPNPGVNKVIVVREIEMFIDRGSWSPINSGVKGYGGDLQLVIKTPSTQTNFEYNTYAVLQKKFLNHLINGAYNADKAVDVIIVRDSPVSQTRAYPNVPLLLRPQNASTTQQLIDNSQTPDDDYYFRITYKIMDMSSDFTPTTT